MSNKSTQSLNQGWEFQRKSETNWLSANVPGCVHLDLIDNGVIDDPFFGENEKMLQWIGETDWNYRLFFTPSENIQRRTNKKICFYGIDTYAVVYLNGHRIIDANNMFHPWEKDVTDILRPDTNELVINFRSPINEIIPRLEKTNYVLPAENDQAAGTSPFTRKAPYHYGWDWGPCLITSGIWREVSLFGWDSWHIDDLSIEQKECNSNHASLKFQVLVESQTSEHGTLVISESSANIHNEYPVKIVEGENVFDHELEIIDPDLWWPAGHGNQPLYTFDITIETEDQTYQISKRIGLRNVFVKREKDENGYSFAVHVNDVPIFLKGANWIPADSFTPRLTKEDYSSLINNAIMANMNTLRVWGGGIYEADYFYDLCDEKGILIWQDFMFACSLYPGNKEFLDSVDQEVRYQVNRLKSHPCIFLWCGNNEIASGWLSWGWKDELSDSVWKEDYKRLFHELIPEICEELDPIRLYWPSSPGHELALPEVDQIYGSGDNHYWGVWHGGDDFDAYEKNIGRFMSEFGMQSFPEINTIKTFANEEDWDIGSDVIRAHQRASLGNKNIKKYIERYYPMPKDFESFVIMSQIMQAEAIRIAVEAHRRKMPYCMGSLYWQFNDCWPGASWSSIDYYGNWKALHYAARRFFDPLLISIIDEDELIKIFLTNDHAQNFRADLSLKLCSFDGTILSDLTKNVEVPSVNSTKILQFDRSELVKSHDISKIMLISELFRKGASLTKNNFFFVRPKEMNLEPPEIEYKYETSNDRHYILIHSKTFVKNLHIVCENSKGIFSDNFFDMFPKESVKIEFKPIKNVNNDILIFKVNSLFDIVN